MEATREGRRRPSVSHPMRKQPRVQLYSRASHGRRRYYERDHTGEADRKQVSSEAIDSAAVEGGGVGVSGYEEVGPAEPLRWEPAEIGEEQITSHRCAHSLLPTGSRSSRQERDTAGGAAVHRATVSSAQVMLCAR